MIPVAAHCRAPAPARGQWASWVPRAARNAYIFRGVKDDELRITGVAVSNFRGISEGVTLRLWNLTALIGPNGSGKTTLLLAIEKFFSKEKGRVRAEDFNDPKRPITITVTLSPKEGPDYEATCEWRYDAEKKSVQTPKYASGGREIKRNDRLLGNISVVYVPAEHETDADGEDRKNTLLERIIDGALRKKASLEADREALQKKFKDEHGRRLGEIKDRINGKLSGDEGVGYAPNTKVSLEFTEPEVKMGTTLKVSDLDSGREVDHKYVGHGTKRAFHMSALEVISEMSLDRDDGDKDKKGDGGKAGDRQDSLTVIAIDEPELHQHPHRQRVILKALRALSESDSHQVVYSTHSPHFVTLKTPMSVRRVVRKGGQMKIHDGKNLAEAHVRGRVIRSLEEAVFAKGVVLVEGHTDEVILDAVFRNAPKGKTTMELLIKGEVAIAECGGSRNVTKFCDVLDSLGVGRFVLWDGDQHHTKKDAIRQTKKQNEEIVRGLGLDPGFLDRLGRAKDDDYVRDGDHVCFKFNAPTYFAACFQKAHAKELEEAIKAGEEIDGSLDLAKLEGMRFFGEVMPAIRGRFAIKGDGGM